ncbi:MAG: NAD(+)/NADH kinase, partial [bacterium]
PQVGRVKIGVKINPHNASTRDAADRVKALFDGKVEHFKILDEDAALKNMYTTPKKVKDDFDLLLVLGGDGTLLTAGRFAAASALPVLGINLGRFGFLSELSLDELPYYADAIVSKMYAVEERMILQAQIPNGDTFIAVNDFVVHETSLVKTSYLHFAIDGEEFPSIPGDGIIVSTPTGSTAYNLSAGGSIVSPGVKAIALALICPHVLTARPLVLPPETRVTIFTRAESILTVDGQYGSVIPPNAEVTIINSPYTLNLARLKNLPFYQALKKKFGWGEGRKE